MSATDPLLGQVLNRAYRVLSRIAEGGMSVIYEAERQRIPRRRVAVKLLHPLAATDEVLVARFTREAEVLADMNHPHIVEMLDANHTEEGQAYYVMELLEGETLRQRLDRKGRLPVGEVLELTEQVGGALSALHEHGFVHRDVIPENIFLQQRPEALIHAKLIDLNLAFWLKQKVDQRDAPEVEGTLGYMPPEQARGRLDQLGPAADVFAMAAVIYEALGGSPAFSDAETEEAYLRQVCNNDPTPITARVPGLSPEVHRVLSRGLCRQREERYQSVEELTEQLGRALAGAARGTAQGFDAAAPRPEEIAAPEPEPAVEPEPTGAADDTDERITYVMGLPELGIAPPAQEPAAEGRDPADRGPAEVPREEQSSEQRVTELVTVDDLSPALRVTEVVAEEDLPPKGRVTEVVPLEEQPGREGPPRREELPRRRVTAVAPAEDRTAHPGGTRFLAEEELASVQTAPPEEHAPKETTFLEEEDLPAAPPLPRRARRVGRQARIRTEAGTPDARTMLLDPDRESWPVIPSEEGRPEDGVHDAPTMLLDPLRKERGQEPGAETRQLAGYLSEGNAGKSVLVIAGVAAVVLLGVGLVHLLDSDVEPSPVPPAAAKKAPPNPVGKASSFSVEVRRPSPEEPEPPEPAATPPRRPSRPSRPIHVSSTPAGAEVFVAGKKIGVTPLKVLTLPDASLFFLLRKQGFRDWSKTVLPGEEEARVVAALQVVPATRPERVTVVVAPGPATRKPVIRAPAAGKPRPVARPTGKLRVGTLHGGAPLWADIYVDGKRVGQSPLLLRRVVAGAHRVEARRKGFRAVSKQIVVRRGKQAAVLLELRK